MPVREAWTWLVVENRPPRDGRGTATIVKVSQTRPRTFGEQRVIRLKLNLPDGFFIEQPIEVDVGLPNAPAEVEHVEDEP